MQLPRLELRGTALLLQRLAFLLFSRAWLTAEARNIGQFFHLTDLHLDANYSEFGDLTRWCHAFQNGRKGPHIGRFGNHNFGNVRIYCDSPWDLVHVALSGMKSVVPEPDYIFWTGDNLPHVPDSMYSTQGYRLFAGMQPNVGLLRRIEHERSKDVIETMQNLTGLLKNTFPGVRIFPVLGNHDYWEASQFPDTRMGGPTNILDRTSNLLHVSNVLAVGGGASTNNTPPRLVYS